MELLNLEDKGHPVNILMEEHKKLLEFADKLKDSAKKIKDASEITDNDTKVLDHLVKHFKESESHYQREENVLFPSLEKHGITDPPAVMWSEHQKIREIKKSLYELVEGQESLPLIDFSMKLEKIANSLQEMLSSHFDKENNTLFPMALQVITPEEFVEIRQQFDEIGYCCFSPEEVLKPVEAAGQPKARPQVEGKVSFETRALSSEEIEAIFDTLPVEITFIDQEDTVRYFNQPEDRIFVRAKAVIGRKVQQCHPQKSLHLVNQIVEDFKSGKRDVADFWVNMGGRMVYIRFFAVRDKAGEYLGAMEVVQNITDIKKIKGEKRLL